MSENVFSHRTRSQDVTISTSVSSSSSILCTDLAAGMVSVSGNTATATLQCFGSADGVTFRALYGFDGAAASVTVPESGGAVTLPDGCYPLRYLRLVSSDDLGTAATAIVSFKS
jgi:hypothetical protein